MLELREIYKYYTPGTVNEMCLFNNFNFKVDDGEFVAVVGSNGSGKTSMLNIICGSIPIDEGAVLINGTNITNMPEYKRMGRKCPEADRQVHQGYRQGYRGEIKRDHDRVVLEGKYWVNTGMLQCGIPAFLHTGGFVYEYSTTCSNHSGRQRTLGKEQRDAA